MFDCVCSSYADLVHAAYCTVHSRTSEIHVDVGDAADRRLQRGTLFRGLATLRQLRKSDGEFSR